MDFSYITQTSSCVPDCAKTGNLGPTRPSDEIVGGTTDNGPDITVPIGGTVVFQPPTNPTVIGDGEGTPGKEISCGEIEVIPPKVTIKIGETYAFNFRVKMSNGVWYSSGLSTSLSARVWSSSDDAIAIFDAPTISGLTQNGYGYIVRGVSAGTVTVSVHYSNPSTKGQAGSTANDNWYGGCDLTGTAELTVIADTVDRCHPVIPSGIQFSEYSNLRISPHSQIPNDTNLIEAHLIEGGDCIMMTATLVAPDGSSTDVSSLVVWSSSDQEIVSIDCFGKACPVSPGTAAITAVLSDTHQDLVTIEVDPNPAEVTQYGHLYTVRPIDTVIVLDRSQSMLIRDEEGFSRVERARQAAKMFLSNIPEEANQVAMVSFAGDWIEGATPETAPQTRADASLDLTLTTDRADVRSALNDFRVVGPLLFLDGKGTRGGTGMGAALQLAQAEINSDRHTYGNKKIILLVVDGCENINDPPPLPVAEDIKQQGTVIVVIALDAPLCEVDLRAIASPGLFFESPTAYELSNLLTALPFTIGYGEYGYSWYSSPY